MYLVCTKYIVLNMYLEHCTTINKIYSQTGCIWKNCRRLKFRLTFVITHSYFQRKKIKLIFFLNFKEPFDEDALFSSFYLENYELHFFHIEFEIVYLKIQIILHSL